MRHICLALLIVMLSFAPALAMDVAVVTVPAKLDDAALSQWSAKTQAYAKSLNSLRSPRSTMKNYRTWAKDAPTGKESYIRGISDMTSSLRNIISAAEDNAKITLSIAPMDKALQEMADAAKVLGPLTADANNYYNRKDYLADDMAKGKEFHGQIIAAYDKLMTAATNLETMVDQISAPLAIQNLAAIERQYGKKYLWQHRNVMLHASTLINTIPESPDVQVDKKAFSDALEQFLAAVTEFDNYYKAAGDNLSKEVMMGLSPSSFNRFIGNARELQSDKDFGTKATAKYGNKVKSMFDSYNSLVDSSNRTRFR